MPSKNLSDEIKKLKSIADTGLLYAKDEYNKDRYSEILEISFNLLSSLSDNSIDDLKLIFEPVKEYPTAKVDIRGILLSDDNRILLVKESADSKWALPGGWADIGYTPQEVIAKEFKEETGLDVTVKSLLAVFDKRKHPHPPQPFYVYKLVFYCQANTKIIEKGFDVLDVDYFNINNLPDLSEDRILKPQIELLYKKIIEKDIITYFD